MDFRKPKKAAAAVMAAVMCVTIAFGTSVSAAEKKSVWSETKALTTAKYNSNYIKWAEKYSAKETEKTISYSKSRTKKFHDKMTAALDKDDAEFAVSVLRNEAIFYLVCKGDKSKAIYYIDDNGIGIYTDSDRMTVVSVEKKAAVSGDRDESYIYSAEKLKDSFDFCFGENTKGKIFKFKSGEKSCCYEEFEGDKYNVGFLFNEKDKPIAMTVDGSGFCFGFSYSVKDSEFDLPKDYRDLSA